MSFHEKSTALMLAIMVVVFGGYAAVVLSAAGDGPVVEIAYQPAMLAAMVALVVLAIVGHIVIALAAPHALDDEDERDTLIDMRGERVGGFVLGIAALVGLGLAMAEANPFWIAHALLAGLVLSEIAKASAMLVDYRRGV